MGCARRFIVCLLAFLFIAPAHALDTVTVGWTPSTPMAPVLIAVDKGYFEREGIAANLTVFRGTMDAMAVLANGQLDVNLGGVTAGFFNAVARGLDLRVVAPLSIQPPAPGSTPLVARGDLWDAGTIRSAADLKGRKVAVNASGNGVDYKLSLILADVGMTLKDVDLTKIAFPEMLTALRTRGIDAGVVGEPFATVAEQEGLGHIMMKESAAGAGDVTTVILFGGTFIRERRDVGVRFLRAVRLGIADLEGDKWRNPDNAAILAKYLQIKPELLLASVFPGFDPSLAMEGRVDSLRRQEEMHRKNGFLNYDGPLDPAAMLDTTLAKEAR